MARINLLPWRAERRKQREREFYIQLGVAFAAALVALIAWSFWMDARIENQGERNAYLQAEIKQLDDRITKIKDLEKVRSDLLQRKQIIEQLQANRSQMVHLFDEMVKTIPASARLSGMKQSGDSMSLDGVSQSNSSVAEYMRNIEASPWMGHADLRKTENTHDASRMPYSFGLDVRLNKPGEADGAAPAGSSTSAAPAAPAAVPAPLAQAAQAATGQPASPAPVAAGPAAQPAGVTTPAPAAAPTGAKP
ncbi:MULTISPECIES: PilN domain-containing protein [unclassified Luteibacter]|uniref:PilN domain-containing protein n=1 Tax=unclassified Luteibacter TaxID=2620188 RepID=UPI0008AB2015|nr:MULTISPECIES: PilN domain-containing protein [unclassified Luteibacter]SEO45610.1 type IV pilus assembly protein PilN [Luteibacter sp. UNC138MFCol5.1]SEW13894.1 type IV pilus assembly protein PilN [Luteibacter sp. 329MFSha]